jgi:hypothetical protein
MSHRWPEDVAHALVRNATWFSRTRESGGNGGADPLVRAGPPGSALLLKNQAIATLHKPARGPAADRGVRPTRASGHPELEN